MKEINLTVKKNNRLSGDCFRFVLFGENLPEMKAGQFLNVEVKGKSLRRPISLCDQNGNELTLAIREAGEGTKILSAMKEGETLSCLLPLGNGFPLEKFDEEVLIVGGGIGVAPMYYTAKQAIEKGLKVTLVLGYRSEEETILLEEFKALNATVYVAYDNKKENVVTKIKEQHLENIPFLSCGPIPMMKAMDSVMTNEGYFSLEARMGCGFGACMGCSIKLKEGMARICKEGPVFNRKDILWENCR